MWFTLCYTAHHLLLSSAGSKIWVQKWNFLIFFFYRGGFFTTNKLSSFKIVTFSSFHYDWVGMGCRLLLCRSLQFSRFPEVGIPFVDDESSECFGCTEGDDVVVVEGI